SKDNILVAGVLSGFAEYFEQDATHWRLAFVVFLIITGVMPGVLIYIGAWIVIPQKPFYEYTDVTRETNSDEDSKDDVNQT
ncbi:MAG: PspC domain-containing protein, partial [Candidatus Paceibacterota bacterium]